MTEIAEVKRALLSIDLASFDLGGYNAGRSSLVRAIWFLLGSPVVNAGWLPISSPRRWLLRLFGAKIGRGVILRPRIKIKNPWLLAIGDHSMIGEDVWIDNLVPVSIGSHVCISQGAYLCTGNHDWSSPSFRYRLGEINIRDGAWIGAKAIVGPAVSIGECAVVCLGSVANKDIQDREIHAGNPAVLVKRRVFYPEDDRPAKRKPPAVRW